MWNTKHSKIYNILNRIEEMKAGSVFVISDFNDIANDKTASKTLTRLGESKVIAKVFRGVFWKPLEDGKLPKALDVASAIARSNGWAIVPTGDTALYISGNISEEPKLITFITDGTGGRYSLGETIIEIAHNPTKDFNVLSTDSELLIQIIKAYGHKGLPNEIKEKILNSYDKSQIKKILNETKDSTKWVFNIICKMFKDKDSYTK